MGIRGAGAAPECPHPALLVILHLEWLGFCLGMGVSGLNTHANHNIFWNHYLFCLVPGGTMAPV